MKRYSIRWWLPVSYAGIAFLTALALGAVLNLVLSDYYAGQERTYLLHNAKSILPAVEHLAAQLRLVSRIRSHAHILPALHAAACVVFPRNTPGMSVENRLVIDANATPGYTHDF